MRNSTRVVIADYSRSESHWASRGVVHKEEWIDCAYCGDRATSKDHVLPVVYSNAHPDMPTERRDLLFTVPACRQCNSIASGRVFDSLGEKRAYIHDELRRRNRKLLESQSWSDEDLKELGPSLRRRLLAQRRRRERLVARLAWGEDE